MLGQGGEYKCLVECHPGSKRAMPRTMTVLKRREHGNIFCDLPEPGAPWTTGIFGQNIFPSLSLGIISSVTSDAAIVQGDEHVLLASYFVLRYTSRCTRYSLEAAGGASPSRVTKTGSVAVSR